MCVFSWELYAPNAINSWVLQLVCGLLALLLCCHVRVQSDRPLALEYDLLSGQLLSQTLLSHIWWCPACGEHSRDAAFSEEANGASLPWHSTAFFCPRLYTRKYLNSIILKINICSSSEHFLFRHWKMLEKMCYNVASEIGGDSL